MPKMADILARYGGAYLAQYGQRMLPSHRRAIQDILRCRTEVMGGHVFRCDQCGHLHYAYHSCGNRNCPQCHHQQTEVWLQKRREELLPVPYFHVVFTVPHELRPLLRQRQAECYGLLMKAAAHALVKLAADPHYVGGRIGVLAVLHTWSRTLTYHPHVHCLVPGGGLDLETRQWRPARAGYLVPVKALGQIFRGLLKDLLGPAMQGYDIPESIWHRPWVVHCEPVVGDIDRVLNYLGRYMNRVAISNRRILSMDNGQVTFRYQDVGSRQWKCMTVGAEEFIRRFCQHVLPKGFHKVRYYGLWAPGYRSVLRRLQLLLAPEDQARSAESAEPENPLGEGEEVHTHPLTGSRCPYCGQGVLKWCGRCPPHGRAPP
jgi:hypothetical protein